MITIFSTDQSTRKKTKENIKMGHMKSFDAVEKIKFILKFSLHNFKFQYLREY